MRALILLSGLFVAAFGAWHVTLRPDPASLEQAAQAQRLHQLATAGIRGFLAGAAEPRVGRAVIGRSAVTGVWEVRGMTDDRSGGRPVYAVLEERCAPADLSDPACWVFARIEIDGVEQTGSATGSAVVAEAATPDQDAASEAEAAEAAPADGEVDAPSPPPTKPEPAVAEQEPRLFEIAAAAVNLREGPGTQFPAVGVARRGERFVFVDERSGWGRFARPGDGAEIEAWISMTLVRPVGE